MNWLVQLTGCFDGSPPDEQYLAGIVIAGRHDDEVALIEAANRAWRTVPIAGEVYKLTPLYHCRTVTVTGANGAYGVNPA